MMSGSSRAQWVALLSAGPAGKCTEAFAFAVVAARRVNPADAVVIGCGLGRYVPDQNQVAFEKCFAFQQRSRSGTGQACGWDMQRKNNTRLKRK
jgi:hypothetical protein